MKLNPQSRAAWLATALVAVVGGCAAPAAVDYDKVALGMIKGSFRDQGQAKVDRLEQDATQRIPQREAEAPLERRNDEPTDTVGQRVLVDSDLLRPQQRLALNGNLLLTRKHSLLGLDRHLTVFVRFAVRGEVVGVKDGARCAGRGVECGAVPGQGHH